MATITESGLFPPIIDSYLPGFNLVEVHQNGLTINFDSSSYNDLTTIARVHVSIVRQSNYHHIFNKTLLLDDYFPAVFHVDALGGIFHVATL